MTDGFRLQDSANTSPVSALNAMLDLGLNGEDPDDDAFQPGEKPGDFIRDYRLVELLGEGGFGSVWLAQQVAPIHRELALKLIKPGMSSRSIVARFEAERQALAMMDHPNIAAVLDAGATADGRSFFAMELVRGISLTAYCDEHRLPIRDRLELFLLVCHAVQHAHQKGIIHRDLKPSNILVTRHDGKAVPKVIDFGVSKALGVSELPAFQASMLYTQIGAVIGTLQYMSPEQAGSVPDVDTRSDIYTLGVILYELLTGSTPFRQEQSTSMAFDEALRHVREGRTTLPSSQIADAKAQVPSLASRRQLEPGALKKILRGDLDWITLKSLEKDRSRRYSTAAALAEDIERYLAGKPVSAVAPTLSYQFARFAQRNRLALATACIVSVALITGTTISLWQARQAKAARLIAETNRQLAEEKSRESEANLEGARHAVETYLDAITEDARLNRADFTGLRQDLLKSALPLYEEMLTRNPDPNLRYSQAQAIHRLANLYQSQGIFAKGEQLQNRSLEETGKLLQAEPNRQDYWKLAQDIHTSLGNLHSELGNYAASLIQAQEALQIGLRLTADQPGANRGRTLAPLYATISIVCQSMGDQDRAEENLRQSVKLAMQTAQANPDNATDASQAAIFSSFLAQLLIYRGKDQEAETICRETVAAQEELLRKDPSNAGNAWQLGGTLITLGNLKYNAGHHDEAIADLRRSADLHAGVYRTYFSNNVYFGQLVIDHANLATLLSHAGKKDEARSEYQEMVNLIQEFERTRSEPPDHSDALGRAYQGLAELSEDPPDSAAVLELYRKSFQAYIKARTLFPNREGQAYLVEVPKVAGQIIRILLTSRQTEEAASVARQLAQTFSNSWEAVALAAKTFALCSADPANPGYDNYRSECVEQLKEAMRLGLPSVKELTSAEDFSAMQDYPPFQALRDSAGR